jgi:hypothetical protein
MMGLLYGHGDIEQSMEIAMRAGQDSDCSTPIVGEVLGTWKGVDAVPEKWKSDLDRGVLLAGTPYTYDDLVELSTRLARSIVEARGGSVEAVGTPDESWTLSADRLTQPILEQWPRNPNERPMLDAHVDEVIGRDVSFSAVASDSDGIEEYEWYFGDLSRAKGGAVTHTYPAPGTYEVTVFVADKTGNASFVSMNVTIELP